METPSSNVQPATGACKTLAEAVDELGEPVGRHVGGADGGVGSNYCLRGPGVVSGRCLGDSPVGTGDAEYSCRHAGLINRPEA
jgi:hypothetical protein